MSISQLDDPSMREALGFADDTLAPPVTMGSVILSDAGGGVLATNGGFTNGGASLAGGQLTGVSAANPPALIPLAITTSSQPLNDTGILSLNHTIGAGPAATGRLSLSTAGELLFQHTAPANTAGLQTIYRSSVVQAEFTGTQAVGGLLNVPLSVVNNVTNTGGGAPVPDWTIVAGTRVQSTVNIGTPNLYQFNATIQLTTTSVGPQQVTAYFVSAAGSYINTGNSITITNRGTLYINEIFELLGQAQIGVCVVSADPNMTVATIPAVVGPPYQEQCNGMELIVQRIA